MTEKISLPFSNKNSVWNGWIVVVNCWQLFLPLLNATNGNFECSTRYKNGSTKNVVLHLVVVVEMTVFRHYLKWIWFFGCLKKCFYLNGKLLEVIQNVKWVTTSWLPKFNFKTWGNEVVLSKCVLPIIEQLTQCLKISKKVRKMQMGHLGDFWLFTFYASSCKISF